MICVKEHLENFAWYEENFAKHIKEYLPKVC